MSFSLMVKNVKKKSNSIKILMLGLDNAGKTTVLSTYLEERVISAPTFGYKIHFKKHGNYSLTILDIGGQAQFKDFWNNYFENADAVVFVVDCSDTRSTTEYINEIARHDVPTAFFFNKYDLNLEFKPMPDCKLPISKSFVTSATENIGITEGFNWLVEEVASRR